MSRFAWLPNASRTRRALILGPVVIAAGLLAGCSVIGYFVGSKIDSHHTKLTTVDSWKLEHIEVGTTVQVFLRNSSGVAGVMRGVGVSPQEYDGRYEQWRKAHADFGAPSIGDGITIEDVGGNRQVTTFYGFDYGALAAGRERSVGVGAIPYRKIERVSTAGGASWAGSRLADLASQGRVPLRSCLLMDNRPRIPLEEIDRVEILQTRYKSRIVGLLVGAAVDGLLIAHVAGATPKPTPPPTYVSCPYVYSFDGERYVKEGDAFPGAMFAAVQRSDRLALGHLDASGARGRIRLTNELSEIEFVDEVKLLAVDGPENATVVPVPAGRFRALSGLTSTVRAVDLNGRPVLPVGVADGGAWLSDPMGRNPAGPEGARDGIVLDFRRPTSAKSVTLMFRAEPLPWASELLVDVLALQGREYPAWYAHMNDDASARTEFLGALRREGHLAVQLWDGVSWRAEGDVPAHEAMELPLEGIPGETLRLRLLTTPGLWRVDGVHADFGPEVPLDVKELSPLTARTAEGEEVSALLASTDGQRLVMKHGESVDVVVTLPPPKPGRQRSYFLKAAGYYAVQVPAAGEPETALFAELLQQPGALGQYGRDILRADLERSLVRLEARADHSGGN